MNAELWALVPAAGVGLRMAAAVPKQYLPLAGECVLAISLQKLLLTPALRGIVVVLSPDDKHFASLPMARHPHVHITTGGQQRADSVLSGLDYLHQNLKVADTARILVHDAARPCVTQAAIQRLLAAVGNQAAGGILAVPVADTLKREFETSAAASTARIESTQDRSQLWQAHTPQLFPLGILRQALQAGLTQGLTLTDEASAMEFLGYAPQLVVDRRDNIKITHPEDLGLAEQILGYHHSLEV